MHLVGNNSSMQPTQLWSVRRSTFVHGCVFINIVFCPCYLFLLWNVVLKCLALCFITIIATSVLASFTYMLASPAHLTVHASSLHPLPARHHLCYVDVYCVFFIFAIFYISLRLHFGLFAYIFSLSFIFLCHSLFFFKLACRCVFGILIVLLYSLG